MSAQAFETVLARLYAEAGFRQRFLEDPEAGLSGYDLTREEKESLFRIDRIGLIMASRSYQAKREKRIPGTPAARWKLPFR